MVEDVQYEDVRKRDDLVWIDVRSPGEFAESALPGAINIPLFTDQERERVGTAYKQISPDKAKEIGVEVVSPKIPQLLQAVREACQGKQAVIYCSRGGMRSKTVATLTDLVGFPVTRLAGGYRSYRNWVVSQLENYQIQARFVMLHGLTGVGKTEVLKELKRLGEPVLDLEALAGHRGSAFGGVGLAPRNQRQFDTLLVESLEELKEQPYLIMEAESKRIGRVQLPEFLLEGREKGIHFLLQADLSVRVHRILSDYMLDTPDFEQFVAGALHSIEKRLSSDVRDELWKCWEEHHWPEFVQQLLVSYYDPLYSHSARQYTCEFIQVNANSVTECATAIRSTLQSLFDANPVSSHAAAGGLLLNPQ